MTNITSIDAPETMTMERNGLTVTMSRDDRWGRIFLHPDKGELPEKYRGAYTTFQKAQEDITKYFNERDKALAELKKDKKVA